jgi:hypothetical protein
VSSLAKHRDFPQPQELVVGDPIIRFCNGTRFWVISLTKYVDNYQGRHRLTTLLDDEEGNNMSWSVLLKVAGLRLTAFILILNFAGCAYRLTPIVRRSTPTPNGVLSLSTEPCQLLKEVPADSVTNVVHSASFFAVGITARSGDNILYRISAESPEVSCALLPQPAARLVGGSDGSLTILNRWAGQAVLPDVKQREIIYLVSPSQMQQSLLHEGPAQFAMQAGDQLFVIHGPTQTSVEVTSISHPGWRLIQPILDATCNLPLSVFDSDTVVYDSSERTFIALLDCGSLKSLAKSKDFANWKTVLDLSSVLPQDAVRISATKSSDGCFVLRWRQQNGIWLAMATCSESKVGSLISGSHSRDVIGIWSGKPIAATLLLGSVGLWAYTESTAQWEQLGSLVGRDCGSYRVASGPPGQAAVICWNLSPRDLATRTRIATGFRTKDGGTTWAEF